MMVKLKSRNESSANTAGSSGSIGERLRSARENKGLSFEDVHKATKIHPKTIEALEKGQLENKVGEAYVKAFLKNYSMYLGMDARSIIEEYSSKKHGSEKRISESSQEALKKEPASKKKLPAKKTDPELVRVIASGIIVILVIFAVIFGLIKVGQYAKGAIAKLKTKSTSHKISGQSKEAAKAPKTVESAIKEIIPIPKQDKLTLTITTSTDVWLKVTLDGEVAFHKTLSKKSKETWKADKEIRLLEIGKPESLKLNVNGKDIDFSKNRLSRNVLITREGVDFEPR